METKTQHKPDCQMAFGRKDPSCPRCQELLAGSPPRQAPWFKRAAQQRETTLRSIRMHNCRLAGCGPVCTFGDW
jgi:hypothetical protein